MTNYINNYITTATAKLRTPKPFSASDLMNPSEFTKADLSNPNVFCSAEDFSTMGPTTPDYDGLGYAMFDTSKGVKIVRLAGEWALSHNGNVIVTSTKLIDVYQTQKLINEGK